MPGVAENWSHGEVRGRVEERTCGMAVAGWKKGLSLKTGAVRRIGSDVSGEGLGVVWGRGSGEAGSW